MKQYKIGFALAILASFSPFFVEGAHSQVWPATGKDREMQGDRFSGERWIPYHSEEDKFSVQFPGFPSYSCEGSSENGKMQMRRADYEATTRDSKRYKISVKEYISSSARKKQPTDPRRALDLFRGVLSEGGCAELVETKLVEVQGFPAIEFVEKGKEGYVQGKVIVVHQFLYYLGAQVSSDKNPDENYSRFINSFRFI